MKTKKYKALVLGTSLALSSLSLLTISSTFVKAEEGEKCEHCKDKKCAHNHDKNKKDCDCKKCKHEHAKKDAPAADKKTDEKKTSTETH